MQCSVYIFFYQSEPNSPIIGCTVEILMSRSRFQLKRIENSLQQKAKKINGISSSISLYLNNVYLTQIVFTTGMRRMLPQWYTKLCFITNHQRKKHVGLLCIIIIIWGIEVEALNDKMYL